ncbi:COG4223 family protein [Methylopila henanensis]|uniref:COG4223 family protein n=1 Tax=Methylopila henanensis TaxID=873516 RepID=A0ABW4KAV1_9HYPH
MADPKGPEQKTGSTGSPARPKSPTLDLSATDVTPKEAPKSGPSAAAKPEDAKPAPKPAESKPAAAPSTAAAASVASTGAARTTPVSPAAGGTGASPSSTSTAPAATGSAPKPGETGAKPSSGPAASGAAAPGATSASSAAAKPTSGPSTTSSASSASQSAKPSAGVTSPSSAPKTEPAPATSGGAGVLGLALAGLIGAGVAVGAVALFGRDLIGAPPADSSRLVATEAKLDAVARELAALREQSGQPAPAADTSAIDAKIDELTKAAADRSRALEAQLQEIANRSPAVQVDTGAVDALGKRIDTIEGKLGDTASAQALQQVGARIDGIGAAIEQALRPISDKIGALETELKARPVGDPDARLVVALGALDQALAAGRPFANELAAAKAAGGGDPLAPLDATAAAGAPTRAALAAELRDVVAALPPIRPAEGASVFDRFLASAGSVVKVTPAEAPAGSSPAEVRLRIVAKAAKGDLAGALAERDGLDDAAKSATDAWAAKAKARLDAEAAVGDARSAALSRLGSN